MINIKTAQFGNLSLKANLFIALLFCQDVCLDNLNGKQDQQYANAFLFVSFAHLDFLSDLKPV